MVEEHEDRCPRCGGQLKAGPTGSITQWLRVCHCHLEVDREALLEDSHFQICDGCGRRIGGGRAGSLTQWIFRPDFCDCSVPQPRTVDQANFDTGSNQALASSPEDETPAIEVDPDKWPSLRYKPLSLLGSGGFGTIYRCHDRLLNKTIALKLMRYLTPQQMVAFQHEARAASRLSHPHIVQVYDFGATDSGAPFMTMEYVNGISMQEHLTECGPLSVSQTINVFRKMCKALAHAHRCGVLHRDIKSSNVVLIDAASEDPGVKLIDFGAAVVKTVDGQSLHAQGSTIAGSPSYMAPDQVLGKAYDERSEVYGVGCTMFEALTGKTPFEGEDALETIRKQASAKAPRLEDVVGESGLFSVELEELVSKCLSKDPDSRFQSMDELMDALGRMQEVADEPLIPEPETTPLPMSPAADRKALNQASPVVMVLLTFVVAFGIIGGWTAYTKANKIAEAKVIPSAVPDLQGSVHDTADTLIEVDKPRFEEMELYGLPGLAGKGALTDEGMIALKGRTDYEALALRRQEISGSGLVYVDAPIKSLYMSHTKLSNQYLPLLKKHEGLEILEADYTNLTDRGLVYLSQLKSLRNLSIGSDLISDKGIENVLRVQALEHLALVDASKVTSVGLQKLAKLPDLKELVLKGINLQTHGTGWLTQLPGLRVLHLENCSVDDQALKLLANSRLEEIQLEGNEQITNAGLIILGRSKSLKVLEITGSPSVTRKALLELEKRNPRLEINKRHEEKALKARLRKRGFSAPTGSVLKDIMEMGDTNSKIFSEGR